MLTGTTGKKVLFSISKQQIKGKHELTIAHISALTAYHKDLETHPKTNL